MAAHAKLGASSASRWMNCPGSIRLSEGAPNQSSFQAREGTVAHTLGELALLCQPEDRYEFLEEQEGKAVDPDHPDIAVSRDMIHAVRQYVGYCGPRMSQAEFTELELRVSLKGYGRDKAGRKVALDMFGTADFVAVFADGILEIADYKHGQGVTVEPLENPQLKYYAAGVLAKLAETDPKLYDKVDTVMTTVVQPRDDHLIPIRHHLYDVKELLAWVDDVLIPAAARTQEPDAPLATGEHCRFCPAQARCPERRRKQLEKAKMVFKKQDDRIIPEKSAQELTIDELRVVLDSAEDIISWVKSCQKYAHEALEQNTLGPDDQKSLGYKLVNKRATRKFSMADEQVADALCEEFGLGDDELFTQKLRSPAQLEKEIGIAKTKKSEVWRSLVVSESSGTTLARGDDSRPAVKKASAKDKFGTPDDDEDEDEDDDGLL